MAESQDSIEIDQVQAMARTEKGGFHHNLAPTLKEANPTGGETKTTAVEIRPKEGSEEASIEREAGILMGLMKGIGAKGGSLEGTFHKVIANDPGISEDPHGTEGVLRGSAMGLQDSEASNLVRGMFETLMETFHNLMKVEL